MKLTLRDFFWLVLVCALAVGWWVERVALTYRIAVLEGRYRNNRAASGSAVDPTGILTP